MKKLLALLGWLLLANTYQAHAQDFTLGGSFRSQAYGDWAGAAFSAGLAGNTSDGVLLSGAVIANTQIAGVEFMIGPSLPFLRDKPKNPTVAGGLLLQFGGEYGFGDAAKFDSVLVDDVNYSVTNARTTLHIGGGLFAYTPKWVLALTGGVIEWTVEILPNMKPQYYLGFTAKYRF